MSCLDDEPGAGSIGVLVEHLFRSRAGQIVSHLARLLGPAHLDLAEEAVQGALLKALQQWPYSGVPDNPAGWLFRVARNAALDAARRSATLQEKTPELAAQLSSSGIDTGFDDALEGQLRDDELRLIFLCCHPAIPGDARVALSLKTVGGFGVSEIARAFLAEEAAIAQRLVRAKRSIRERNLNLDLPSGADLRERLDSVLEVIYLMFNEGYTAHSGENLVRLDLCGEALRLGRLVAASAVGAPRVDALVALLAFQAARLPARVDPAGELVLLEDQDPNLWDQRLIALGFHHLERSAEGAEISTYHVEAAIAATHARATDPHSVEWKTILMLYDQLLALNRSPVVALNRAVALAKVEGPAAALAAIEPLSRESSLRRYYLLPAVRGGLLLDLGDRRAAAASFREALDRGCSEPERRFLRRKLAECEPTAT